MVNKTIKAMRITLADLDRCRINFILYHLQIVFILGVEFLFIVSLKPVIVNFCQSE